jgi:ferredoxin-type protein NapH
MEQVIGQELANELTPYSGEFTQTHFSTTFQFNSAVNALFRKYNEHQLAIYRIGAMELGAILAQYEDGTEFNTQLIAVALSSQKTEATSEKIKKLKAYSDWMNGRVYGSKAELEQVLSKTIDNINGSIIYDYGIDSGRSKNLRFAMTKEAYIGAIKEETGLWMFLALLLPIIGALMYILPKAKTDGPAGIKNNGIFHNSLKNRGWLGMSLGVFLILFYIALYWYPEHIVAWVHLVDPISYLIKGQAASQWFFYGLLYTLAILVMGVRMFMKYRHSNYHLVRTASLMFFQTAFAFLIPEILIRLNKPYYDFKNIWPLDYSFFFDYQLDQKIEAGTLGIFMLVWGIALTAIAVPVFTYFYGKRWYCSWVCGCGGLAETLGDPYRQLSDKSLKAWKFERYSVHGVLVFAVLMTVAVLYTYYSGQSQLFGILDSYQIRSVYGFAIGAAFAGVVGTGFYPFMGNRVWCRFGCPLAAYLGLIQRFKSRFRITTNGGQCISCGNCSTYC